MPGKVVFITGGARSGKSHFAQKEAAALGFPVAYVATASARDEEMRARIEEHRCSRPKEWLTIEEEVDLIGSLSSLKEAHTVIIDCLTLWTTNLMERGLNDSEVLSKTEELLVYMKTSPHTFFVISNEVGWGVVPLAPLGRRFRDLQGLVNQMVARMADEVYLMVCGLPLRVKP